MAEAGAGAGAGRSTQIAHHRRICTVPLMVHLGVCVIIICIRMHITMARNRSRSRHRGRGRGRSTSRNRRRSRSQSRWQGRSRKDRGSRRVAGQDKKLKINFYCYGAHTYRGSSCTSLYLFACLRHSFSADVSYVCACRCPSPPHYPSPSSILARIHFPPPAFPVAWKIQ